MPGNSMIQRLVLLEQRMHVSENDPMRIMWDFQQKLESTQNDPESFSAEFSERWIRDRYQRHLKSRGIENDVEPEPSVAELWKLLLGFDWVPDSYESYMKKYHDENRRMAMKALYGLGMAIPEGDDEEF